MSAKDIWELKPDYKESMDIRGEPTKYVLVVPTSGNY